MTKIASTICSTVSPIRRIASHWVLSPQGLLRNGIVSVGADGQIVSVETSDSLDSVAGVEFFSGMLIPGLVNAHSHLELSYLKGAIPPGGGFSAFAKGVAANRNRFSPEEMAYAAEFQDAKMWDEGVSAVGDICNGTISFRAKSKSKIAYKNFAEVFGLGVESLDEINNVVSSARESGLDCTITPHSTYSLNNKGFGLAVGGSENDPLSIHFAESAGERELYSLKGEMWDWYESKGFKIDFADYGSPANRIKECVPSDRGLLLVHNTNATEGEIEMLQNKFGKHLTWVLCPRSNAYITGQYPPVELLRNAGARIALGTDSLSSNHSISMIEEMKQVKGVPLTELLCWATINGAQALGLDSELGSFEVGKKPGIVLLTGIDWETMSLTHVAKTTRII